MIEFLQAIRQYLAERGVQFNIYTPAGTDARPYIAHQSEKYYIIITIIHGECEIVMDPNGRSKYQYTITYSIDLSDPNSLQQIYERVTAKEIGVKTGKKLSPGGLDI